MDKEDEYEIWPMAEEVRSKYRNRSQLLPLHFVHDEIYIVIIGDSNYTISYSSGNVEGRLRDGHIVPVHLSKLNPYGIFIYEHYDIGVQPIFEIVGLNSTELH